MKRTVNFDYLRVAATFAVIILHLAGQNWSSSNVDGFEWQVFNAYDSIVRWTVPVFVMISGAIFLERSINIKRIYTKYVLRLFLSFYIWSLIYVLFSGTTQSFFDRSIMFIYGHYHMWFIPMMAGLYICMPFFKAIVSSKKRTEYFLCLAFILSSFIPTFAVIINDFTASVFLHGIASAIKISFESLKINFVAGYAGYFILGYYLNNINLSKQQRKIAYSLGVMGCAMTLVLSILVAIKNRIPSENYYDYFRINVLLESVAVFLFFKYRNFKNNNLVFLLSKYSYGAYLVHALIIEILNSCFSLNTLSFNAVLAVPCIGFMVFIISNFISSVLNKIPYINKYIV